MIFIDTHIVVWLYQKDKNRFSDLALQLLESDDLRISPAVAFEIEYLFETGRLTERSRPILAWLERTIQLKEDQAAFSAVGEAALDESWTRDPFDRLIVAHANLYGAPLLSKDRTIRERYRHARW
ncbi:MAG TPA: PIN domain-containing protein [Treponemataceae bacterium]|nr:PIN domain-containing protein [Treponemataceae bacterium]